MPEGLAKGQNGPLATTEVRVVVQSPADGDLAALLLTKGGKVRSDADFVFFNQPVGPGVRVLPGGPGQPPQLVITLVDVPADIDQIRAVLTLDDATASFADYAAPTASVSDSAGHPLFEYRIDGLSSESVVIALEIYRREASWKVRAVGQGYSGGFAALITDHGITVDDPPALAPEATLVRTVASEAKLPLAKRQKLDRRKAEVAKVLMSKGANGIRARVVLVIDKTGSMHKQYRSRTVHRVVERMIPVATQIDDDGQLEPYLYGRYFARLPDIPIMNEIISSVKAGDSIPTLVLFFTDGGFSKRAEITGLMQRASTLPAFWQFVGLGEANYGLLKHLDTLDGRVVDNAGFFALDDIDAIDDRELYRRLLGEFPDWLRLGRSARIVGE